MSNIIKRKSTILKNFQGKFFKDDLFFHTIIMMVGTKLGDIFSLIYRLAMIRLLTVEEYGTLNSLISSSLILSQFIAPFQPVLTKYFAEYSSKGEWAQFRFLRRRIWRDLGIFSIVIAIIIISLSGEIRGYLNIEEISYILLAGAMIICTILLAVPMAVIQGTQAFVSLASISALSAFFKMIIGIGLIMLAGLTVDGALGGMIASPVSAILIGIFLINKYLKSSPAEGESERIAMLPIYKYFIPTALTLGSLWALTNVDVILVKHFFTGQEPGYYSVSQMVGLMVLYLPGAITIVIYPKAAAAHAKSLESRRMLWKGLAVVAGFSLLGVVLCSVAPGMILTVLSGKNNLQSRELVPWFAMAMSFFSLSMLVVFYHLAVNNARIAIPLIVLVIAEIITIYFHHPALIDIIYIVLSYSIITFVVSLFMLRYINVNPTQGNNL